MILHSFVKKPSDGSSRQHFEEMAVRVAEVKASAAAAGIDLHVFGRARPAAIGEPLAAHPLEDSVELHLAHLEGIVMPLEAVPIVEINRQRVVDPHRSEVRDRTLIFEAEDPGEEAG